MTVNFNGGRNCGALLLALGFAAACSFAPEARGESPGVVFTTVATFANTNNGANPYDAPTRGADGALYGTTPYGGSNNVGVVFKVATNSAAVVTLHVFDTTNGSYPVAPLVFGLDGNLYGVTTGGGSNNLGAIFAITTNGAFRMLYSFGAATNAQGSSLDGSAPNGGMVLGRDGNFYGTTSAGGATNAGTVFRFSTNGGFATLHSFTGADGEYPYTAPLVEGGDGVFYGTTAGGGGGGAGTVYQITADGTLATLVDFNVTNGQAPRAGVCFGADGNLYGTTVYGGAKGTGTAFQVTTNGVLATLFQFTNSSNGVYPLGAMVAGPNNDLYGATYAGGQNGRGTVYQLGTNGALTTLHSFAAGADGADPFGGVIRDANGNLYGTAYSGGVGAGKKAGYGIVYRLGFNPVISITLPTANESWSNTVLTATGTAGGYLGVAAVFYSLDGEAWASATLAPNGSNWTAGLAVSPGTNTLQAYAVDDGGNVSPIARARFIGVLSSPLTVRTNGSGTVNPNYNNTPLRIGASYEMTARAAAGFGLVDWTGGNGNVVTNGATLEFVMASNLVFTANFADITKPAVTIVAPTGNQKWSNAVFTVSGKASDNVAVSNVFYSLDGANWASPATTNRWTNWTASVTLAPGTNTLQAYAVDTSGNVSATETVKFVYILAAPLTVLTNGRGSVNPNYNNALLPIGATDAMTATAATGFGFVNWTDGNGNAVTNGATLRFVMESNLVLVAHFADITKPTVTIVSPVANQKTTNSVFSATGKASDNVAVANVFYSLNAAGWANPATTNHWTNWTVSVPLAPGTNTLSAYAVDTSGNLSATNTVKLKRVSGSP
jgi:uncharacterized repeat protein (TIGR03803 family)